MLRCVIMSESPVSLAQHQTVGRGGGSAKCISTEVRGDYVVCGMSLAFLALLNALIKAGAYVQPRWCRIGWEASILL